MKNRLKIARFVFLVAALTGAVWLPSRNAAAMWGCYYSCDGDTTVTYTVADSFEHCRGDAYNACIPRGVGGTYCYSDPYGGSCESW